MGEEPWRKLGGVVIGLGLIGRVHANAIATHPELSLIGVVDVDERRGTEVAEANGNVSWSTELGGYLDNDAVDFVVVSTPDNVHRGPAVAVLESGKHLLLEKPIAHTLEDADAIIEAASSSEGAFLVGHTYRFDVNYVKIREAIADGAIGRPFSFYGRQNISVRDARLVAARVGINLYVSVHNFDLMCWYFDDEPVSVLAEAVHGPVYEELGTPDGYWTLVRFRDGAVGCDEAFWTLPDSLAAWERPAGWASAFTPGDCRVEVLGPRGALHLEYPPTPLSLLDEEGWKYPDTTVAPTLGTSRVGALRVELDHFVACMRGRATPIVNSQDARRAVEIALAAARSAASGERVTLPVGAETPGSGAR